MVEPPLQVSGMSAVIAFRDDSQRTAESMLAQRNIRSGRSPAPQNSAPPADPDRLAIGIDGLRAFPGLHEVSVFGGRQLVATAGTLV